VFDNLKEYFYKQNGTKELASTRIVYKHTNKPLTHILHEDTVRFSGDQNGEIYFEIANHSEFHLTIDNLNTNKNKINKIYLLRPFETIIIERNEVLGCVMILEEYITDKGKPLMFTDERSRCFGIIKIGFDRVFGETSSREIGYYWKFLFKKPSVKERRLMELVIHLVHCLRLDEHLNKSDSKKQQYLRNYMPLLILISD